MTIVSATQLTLLHFDVRWFMQLFGCDLSHIILLSMSSLCPLLYRFAVSHSQSAAECNLKLVMPPCLLEDVPRPSCSSFYTMDMFSYAASLGCITHYHCTWTCTPSEILPNLHRGDAAGSQDAMLGVNCNS